MKKLKNKNIVTIENGQDERGGLIACVHSSKSADKVYAKFLWRTQLTPKTETIDHIFTIEEIDDGNELSLNIFKFYWNILVINNLCCRISGCTSTVDKKFLQKTTEER